MPKSEDLTGKVFSRLTVLKKDEEASKKHHRTYWICQCSCGNQKSIAALSLKNGATKSCGCLRNEKVFEAIGKDETGNKYGKLTVLYKDTVSKSVNGKAKWICRCDCGNIVSVVGAELRSGNTTSCGCKNGISLGEQKIIDILEENNISFAKEFKFSELKNKRYDFAIFNKDNNLIRLVEFDGEQHFKPAKWGRESFERTQQSDLIKNYFAFEHNIPLVRIPYWEKDNITIEMIFSDKYLVKKGES